MALRIGVLLAAAPPLSAPQLAQLAMLVRANSATRPIQQTAWSKFAAQTVARREKQGIVEVAHSLGSSSLRRAGSTCVNPGALVLSPQNAHLQQILGLGAFASGAALIPLTVTIMIGMVAVAPRLIARFGPKAMTVSGLATLGAGLVWLSFVRPDGSFVVDMLPASLVTAAGMAMAFIPSLGTALSSAAPAEGGLAAGIVNSSYQIGSALGLASMTAVAAAFGADKIGDAGALTDGFSAGLLGSAGIATVGAVLAAVLLKTPADKAAAEGSRPELAAV